MKKVTCLAGLIAIFVLLMGASCFAEAGMKRGLGIKAGYSIDPDQFTIGGQSILASYGKIDLAPSLDFGTGDGGKVVTLNADGTLNLVTLPRSNITFYVGAGPTLALIYPDEGDSDTEIGLSLLGGFKVEAGNNNFYNLVARIGIGDIPEFKILVGYMFGLGEKK